MRPVEVAKLVAPNAKHAKYSSRRHQRRGEDAIDRPRIKTTNIMRLCAIHMDFYPLVTGASRPSPVNTLRCVRLALSLSDVHGTS